MILATLDMIESRIFVQISVPSNIQFIFTMMAIGGFIKLLEVSGGAKASTRGMTRFSPLPQSLILSYCPGNACRITHCGPAGHFLGDFCGFLADKRQWMGIISRD